jgi:putative Ca2+/H+ antiporter (TMEM165/GDT1 family)
MMSWMPIFAATYAAVFIAEIAGDKLLYTTGVLAVRYRSTPIILGMALAFMIKMGAAVLLGQAIAHLPKPVIAALTAASFVGVMFVLWRKSDDLPRDGETKSNALTQPALVTFATILLSEWADVGMITAATMAANNANALVIVWLGAVAAMVTKGLAAAFLGAGLRQWIRNRVQPKHLRYASVIALAILGAAAVAEDMGWIDEE